MIKENSFVFIAGPCVLDSQEKAISIADNLIKITKKLNNIADTTLIFKASFDKANRSDVKSYRGPGPEQGLKMLEKVKSEFGCLITTDIHYPEQAPYVSSIVDMIQIPAFLCRQTDLLVAAGKTGRIVNVKKGQFLAPWEASNIIEKVKSGSESANVYITERGSSFGYNNLVVDLTSMVFMKNTLDAGIIFDATHSAPSMYNMISKDRSSGRRYFIPHLARAAAATGAINGLFMEVYDNPDAALCDGVTSIAISNVEKIMSTVLKVWLMAREAAEKENV